MATIDAIAEWRIVFDVFGEAYAHAQLIPADDDPADWRRSLEIALTRLPASTDLMTLSEHTRSEVLARVGDATGTFSFDIRACEPSRLLQVWRLRGHCLLEDQVEVTLFAHAEDEFRAVTFAARGEESEESLEPGVRLVSGLPPDWWPTRGRERGGTPYRIVDETEWQRISAQISAPPPLFGPENARQRKAATVGRIPRPAQPELWALGNALFAMSCLQAIAVRKTDLNVARRSLQQALEVLEPGSDMWARCVRSLAVAWGKIADRGAARCHACAAYCARAALAAFDRLGNDIEVPSLEHLLGVQLLRSEDLDLTILHEAVALLKDSAARTSIDSSPIEWCEIMLSIADAHFDLDAFGEPDAAGTAIGLYEKVQSIVTQDERFQHDPARKDQAMWLFGTATERLTRLDRAGVTMPVLPDWWGDRPVHGEALYLRPLTASRQIMLRNRFNADRFAVRFETEPESISLESALYRVLGPYYNFRSVGGRVDGLGMSRIYVVGGTGWQALVEQTLPRARLIVMIPSRSAGVRWEIERLIALDALPRTLFLFPPDDGTQEISEMIDGGRWILNELGISVPDPDSCGMWFQSDARGGSPRVIPFDAIWEGTLPQLLEPT